MYVLTYILLALSALNEYGTTKKIRTSILFFVCFVWLVLHDGLRWEMATDWFAYLRQFKDIVSGQYSGTHEVLYKYFMVFVSIISHEYTVFLLCHAILIYSLYFLWIKRYLDKMGGNPFIALIIFYSNMIGLLGMNRQHIALAICLFSTTFLLEKKYKTFAALSVLATGFHTTAVLFPFFAWFCNRRFSTKYILLFAAGVVGMQVSGITPKLFTILASLMGETAQSKSEFYLAYAENNELMSLNFLRLGRECAVLFFIYLFRRKIDWKNRYFLMAFNMYIIGILIMIAISGSPMAILYSRFSLYFMIFSAILWGWTSNACPKKYFLPFWVLIILFSIISFFRSIAVYPEIFIPYKSVFD